MLTKTENAARDAENRRLKRGIFQDSASQPQMASNRETNGDAKFLETLDDRARAEVLTNGTQMTLRGGFGSPRATLQEIENGTRGQRVCKPLV